MKTETIESVQAEHIALLKRRLKSTQEHLEHANAQVHRACAAGEFWKASFEEAMEMVTKRW